MKKLFVDVHVLQSVPSSCINRDDTGSPKTCQYGGVMRGRVSSQSWKHAVRMDFKDNCPDLIGIRTMWFVGILRELLQEKMPTVSEQDADLVSIVMLNAYFGLEELKEGKDKDAEDAEDSAELDEPTMRKMGALTFLSKDELNAFADVIVDAWDDVYKFALKHVGSEKKQAKSAVPAKVAKLCDKIFDGSHVSADMALFGRMVAETQHFSVEGTCCVAHALATHETDTEFDYYTAVDDAQPDGVTGASNLGNLEYLSMTMYRYATLDVTGLSKYMGENTGAVLREFVRDFVLSMPSGKSHSYANFTLPAFVYVTVRHDKGINLCSAFEEPVRSDDGYLKPSIEAFMKYKEDLYQAYDNRPDQEWIVQVGKTEGMTMPDLLNHVSGLLQTEEVKEEV